MVTVSKSDHGKVSAQRARLLRAQAARAELKLGTERGQLVNVDAAASVIECVIVAIRAKLLALPGKAAPRVVACNNLNEVKALLDEQVRDCLTEIASIDPSASPSPLPAGHRARKAGKAAEAVR